MHFSSERKRYKVLNLLRQKFEETTAEETAEKEHIKKVIETTQEILQRYSLSFSQKYPNHA